MIKLLLSVALLLALQPSLFQDHVTHGQTNQSLKLGESITREFVGGQPHSYKIALTAGQYLEVAVEQRGIDLAVRAFDGSGRQLAKANMFRRGAEPLSIIAHMAGNWRLEIGAADATATASGSYEVRIVQQRVATEQDIAQVNAEQSFETAEELLFHDTPESRQGAAEKYSEALAVWRATGAMRREARTLNGLGLAYIKSNPRQALEYQKQALPLWRKTGDRLMEAATLFSIGSAHAVSLQFKEAREPLEQALPMLREEEDRGLEAATLIAIGGVYLLNEPQRALSYLTDSLAIWQTLKEHNKEAHALRLIGMAHNLLGEKQKATEFHNRSRAILESISSSTGVIESPDSPRQAADRSLAQGLELMAMEKPELIPKAIEKFEQALPLWRKLGDRIAEANTMAIIGSAHVELRNCQKAIS